MSKQQQLSATDELFTMADAIRDDDLYDVGITDWEKKSESIGNSTAETVVVSFQTPTDGVQENTFPWPRKPTMDNEFVQVLMAALDLDDPVAAVSRAGSLKSPQEEDVAAVVPCDCENGDWMLQPSVSILEDDEGDDDTATEWSVGVVGAIAAPLLTMFIPLWFTDDDFTPKDEAMLGAMFGNILYTALILLILL